MLQQTLTYFITGSTAVLQGEGNNIVFSNVSLNIFGSEYETGVPGGFKSTVGTIRIELYSGSILVADFPYDQTNLIINSSSAAFATSSNNINLQLSYKSEIYPNSPYNIKITKSSSLDVLTEASFPNAFVNLSANSSSKYIAEAYSGDNKYNELALYDATSSLLLTSSWVTGSGSIVLNLTGSSFYFIDITTSGSTCCSPTLTSVEGLGYDTLKFTYETGSCGTFDSMSVFQSTDQINWNILASGSSDTSIISDPGSYPSSASYYRLVQHCDDGINMYNSDPSDYLLFIPDAVPSIPNFYYVSIIGRINSGTGSLAFYYSPDSGSTQIGLGYFNYSTIYQPITSFFIHSGSTLIINPYLCYIYGVGYNGSFGPYGSGNTNTSGNYGIIISSSTTIYVNINVGLAVC